MANQELDTRVTPQARGLYPWGRYWAKMTDAYLAGFIIGALFPGFVRAYGAGGVFLAGIVVFPALEAVSIALWGTTPGKGLFRISVLDEDGGKLTLPTSLRRSFGSWISGGAVGIPLLSIFAMLSAYDSYSANGATTWDQDRHARFIGAKPTWWSWIGLGVAGMVYFALAVLGEMGSAAS